MADMKKLLALLILILSTGFSSAQEAMYQSLMHEANQYYADGKFPEAIETYEKILAVHYESSALYFNLGNAYFKEGNIPSAVLYYEKALKLEPNDPDIRYNLELANSRVIDKIEPLPEFFLKTWWHNAMNMFSSDRWARIGLVSLFLMLTSVFVFIVSRSVLLRKISFWAGVALAVMMIMAFVFSTGTYRHYQRQDSGIIFTPTVTVKSSPNENSVDLFVIHEGTKVFILDHVEGWSEIRLANGNVGWLRSSVYKPI